MTPQKLLQWVRSAASGEAVVYYAGNPHHEAAQPPVFHAARKLHEEGKVLLYRSTGQWCARKISTSVKRFIDATSASVPTPPMGPYGLYAAGKGPDPDKRGLNNAPSSSGKRLGDGDLGVRVWRAPRPEADAA